MQFVEVPDFLVNATNVYRTDGYIVRQELLLNDDDEQGTHLFSRDTYFLCTPKRDREYEEVFADRHERNGIWRNYGKQQVPRRQMERSRQAREGLCGGTQGKSPQVGRQRKARSLPIMKQICVRDIFSVSATTAGCSSTGRRGTQASPSRKPARCPKNPGRRSRTRSKKQRKAKEANNQWIPRS